MLSLTVGYVSGIIAAAVFVLQFLIPNALIVILVGILGDAHTAVTWSVVERSLLGSLWPLFLRADSAATRGVDRSVCLVTWLKPLGLGLITVAAIVTPLGLYDAIEPGRRTVLTTMAYVSDPSPFGYGTAARSGQGFTRSCGDFAPLQCPATTVVIMYDYMNSTDGETIGVNATIPNDDYDIRIPKVLAELYQSGLAQHPKSVSSFFDIQTRLWGWSHQKGVNNGKRYAVDAFQTLSSVILNDAIEPFEGLVVDTVSGALGLRNHTVPTGVGMGAEWSEDLLFIEPESECVNLNVSIEFKAPWKSTSQFDLVNISLVDGGGFAKIVPEYPHLDLSDSQRDPQLRNRAYKAAWMTNAYTMLTMNLTRPSPDAFGYIKSKVGDRFTTTTDLTAGTSLVGIHLTSLYMNLLNPEGYVSNYSLVDAPGANYSNPWGINSTDYSDVSLICSGAGGMDYTNASNIHVECGLLFGAARRKDGRDSLIFEPDAWYTQPVYSCASATKASIKTVQFKYNATVEGRSGAPDLRSLSVTSVKPKVYPNKESMPLWGIETVDFALHDLTQLWGLISPEQEHAVNLTTIRAPQLYLPGYGGILSAAVMGYQYVPGTTGPRNALTGIYGDATGGSGLGMADYTGQLNMAMNTKWRECSRNETTVPKILNLIWTDYAANMLVGTRNWNTKSEVPPNLQKRDGTSFSDGDTLVPVTVYERQVRYHWYFAIPALLSLALVALVTLAAFLLMIFGKGSPSRIDHYLKNLSSGRLIGTLQYPAEDNQAKTKEWIARVGRRQSGLNRHSAVSDGPSLSTPFFGQQAAYPEKDAEMVSHTPTNGGSPRRGGYEKVSTYTHSSDEVFGQAR